MVIAADLSSDDEDMANSHSGAAPVLQEALGVTPTGTCVRHPNCPVLSLAHNKVMSCRVCFSEEKSVGIRQRKSFAAVVQQLQQQSEGAKGDKDDDDDDDEPRRRVKRAHSASMQALILQQPQTMESIMKRLGQVQNWMLRQKEKEVMSLQLHIQRLEQRLHDTEVQNQEQKQTIWALRRTIQQDLKIIKTMAVQHERELENGSRCGGVSNALDRSSAHRSLSSGTGDVGSVSGMEVRSPKFALSDSGSISSADNTPSASPMKLLPPLAGESPASGRTNNSTSQHSRIQASLEKYKRAQALSSTPRQRTSSSDNNGDQPVSYLHKDVFVENQRSSYWNDEEVDRMSSNPAKVFASFRGGLLDIPKSPPPARHDSRRKLQLNADDLAQLKMPRMRGIGRSFSHASSASAISDDGSSAPSIPGLPPMDGLLGAASGPGSGGGGVPTTLLSLPMPVSIGETSPEVIYEEPKSAADASPPATGGDGTSNESSNNKAVSSMPEPPSLHSPPAQNAKIPTRSSPSHESTSSKDKNDTSTTTTTVSAAGSTAMERGKVKNNNNHAEASTDNKTVLTATYSVTSLSKQLSAKTFASGYDQHSVATNSTFAAEEEEGDQADDLVIALIAAGEQSSPAQEQQSPVSEETDKSKGDGGSGGGVISNRKGGGDDQDNKEGTLFDVTGAQCQDKYGDTGMYVGTILVTQGMPHGEGTMNYDSGRVYSGSWVVGQWHGNGKLLNPNGDMYEGQFIFDARHGKGLYKWDNGDVYTGDFSQDKRNGHGKFCFHNGNVYEGEFRDGMFEGFGRYDFEGGSYEGEWVQGRYHGEGTLTYASGGKYTGEFRDSLAHGFGMEILPDGRKRRGMWEAGQPTQRFVKP